MEFQLSISVSCEGNAGLTDEVVVSDKSFFSELRTRYPDNSVNPSWFKLRLSYKDAKQIDLFERFRAATGKNPISDHYFAATALDNYYVVNVERIPEPNELNEAPWLYLVTPQLSLAEFRGVENDGSYVVKKTFRCKKIAYGSTRTVGEMLMLTEGLKDRFAKSELRGISFRSVRLENGNPSGLWQFMTEARMPPLAMELVTGRGREPYSGDDTQIVGPKEVGYFPMVLRYKENDLSSLPDLDLLFSAERFGWTAHNNHRMHVVSQRFRQVAEKLAPGQFRYGLLAIGDGDELRRRYTISELAPPEA
jgi:hypothetical protein